MSLNSHDRIASPLFAAGMQVTITPAHQVVTLHNPQGLPLARLRLLANVDAIDAVDEIRVTEVDVNSSDSRLQQVTVTADSSLWQRHHTVLRAGEDALELATTVHGTGRVAGVRQLGARAAGLGLLPSDLLHRTLFSPNPDQPWRVLRAAAEPAALGVVGDGGQPGVGRWLFTPPPLCFALSPQNQASAGPPWTGRWLMAGVAAQRRPFTQLTYEALTPGFCLRYDYEGHTTVADQFTTPTLLLFRADDPYQGLARYRELLGARGLLPARTAPVPSSAWLEPIFSGWGAQSADALTSTGASRTPSAWSRAVDYDRYLATLERHGIVPGTIVIDDKWQQHYATCLPDLGKWPDLAGWIRNRHDAGQRVLLWYKAWDVDGAPPEACVRDHTGQPVALDPETTAGRRVIQQAARSIVGDLDADGAKIDFTAATPAGSTLTHAGPSWGIDLLHELLLVFYRAMKEIKPDALVVTHTPEPGFRDVTDMIRLNDILMLDQLGGDAEPALATPGRPVVDTMTHRARVACAACPELPIDTDGWALPSQAAYGSWTAAQTTLGVPSLYYVDRLDVPDASQRSVPPALLYATAQHWTLYRARHAKQRSADEGAANERSTSSSTSQDTWTSPSVP